MRSAERIQRQRELTAARASGGGGAERAGWERGGLAAAETGRSAPAGVVAGPCRTEPGFGRRLPFAMSLLHTS
jgi:hypothetical protein